MHAEHVRSHEQSTKCRITAAEQRHPRVREHRAPLVVEAVRAKMRRRQPRFGVALMARLVLRKHSFP